MSLWVAAALFAVFVANVAIGASSSPRVLGDVSEMLVLLASSCAFVAAILQAEARAMRRRRDETAR